MVSLYVTFDEYKAFGFRGFIVVFFRILFIINVCVLLSFVNNTYI